MPPSSTLTKAVDFIERIKKANAKVLNHTAYTNDGNQAQYLLPILKSLLLELAYKKSEIELKTLSEIFETLGDFTYSIGKVSNNLKYYTDAAIFHQYVISIVKDKILGAQTKQIQLSLADQNHYSEKIAQQYKKLDIIKGGILSFIFCSDSIQATRVDDAKTESDRHKATLQSLRDESTKKVEELASQRSAGGDSHYVDASRSLFEMIADRMKGCLATLYKESQEELQEIGITPTSTYSVIGLGSLALKQATPYSDLEFAILIASEGRDKAESDKIKQYFKNLTHLVHFKVINLGETIIPKSKYGLDLSHLVHQGVNLDLGGKTPLGRINVDKPYNLIKTVDRMMRYVQNENDKGTHIDKALPFILENVTYIHGDTSLVEKYKASVTEFLHASADVQVGVEVTQAAAMVQVVKLEPKAEQDRATQTDILHTPQDIITPNTLQHEQRAIKVLKEGATELDYNYTKPLTTLLKQTHHEGDLSKLQPHLSDSDGKLFNVKQEIYRLPDRLIYNLGMLCGVQGESNWDTIDKLFTQGRINDTAAQNLKNAITFASILRLKTYLHNKSQTENLSLFAGENFTEDTAKQSERVFHLPRADLIEDGALFKYFYTALKLYKKLEEFCKRSIHLIPEAEIDFFKYDSFYENTVDSKGLIHYRLTQYTKAQVELEKAIQDPQNQHNVYLRNVLGNIYNYFGQVGKAIEQFEYCLKKVRYHSEDKDTASTYNNLGITYCTQGNFGKALEYCTQALEIRKKLLKLHPESTDIISGIASSYSALGNIYGSMKEYKKAIEYYNASLSINRSLDDALHIVGDLNNLGCANYYQEQYDAAEDNYTESLELYHKIYYGEPHPSITYVLNGIGYMYDKKGSHYYSDAIVSYSKAMQIILYFSNHCYQKPITDALEFVAKKFATHHSLDPQKIATKVLTYTKEGYDFTNHMLHYLLAFFAPYNSYDSTHTIIEECTLAKILLPKIDHPMKSQAKAIIAKIPMPPIFGLLTQGFLTPILGRSCMVEASLFFKIDDPSTTTLQTVISNNIAVLKSASSSNFELLRSSMGDINIVLKSLHSGAITNLSISLLQAIICSEEEIVKNLLSHKISLNKPDPHGTFPLHYSLGSVRQSINLSIVELLLQTGVNPNQSMNNGDTPMHMAHYRGSIDAIKLLLRYQGNLNTTNKEGKTPLHCLIENQALDHTTKQEVILEFLYQYDSTKADNNGETPIDYAAAHLPAMIELMMNSVPLPPVVQLQEHISSSSTDTIATVDLHLLGEGVGGSTSNIAHHDGA